MANGKKPKNVDFGSMERKLREMGVSGSLDHLKASSSKPSSAAVPAPAPSQASNTVPPKPAISQQRSALPKSLVEETTHEKVPSDWCNYIFGTLLSIYESTWLKSYGRRPTGRFLDFADSVTEAELMRIMQHCRERLQAGEKWPPIMGELTLLKSQLTESELMEAMNRVVAKTPQNQLETWIIQNKGYELRRVPQSMIIKRFKEFYREAMSLQEKGKLVTEVPKGLAQHSVKNLVDIKREEFEQAHGKSLDPRIEALLKNKPVI
ncbi:hypothetical protein BCU70_14445 [Vibrio sp. 10N.286.49.C2]|uniref:hypothetical protein n=1 Tax=unclassified Vibrio TaxID=2614977 RepID=UPI000C829046|nr:MULTISPECIES: hypothetical protein [unclassified Vibrio]PMH37862.1 hypothetical protein BCU70_14445 [Vibrio sp. 10N.286.49.C2]PMH53206.1 hypothetical protein BCU66_14445 [Vibrio sp. 10N.286.49.B1]PMH77783.1 hypothetical protein BCU58_11700 [Vibrio sp. 10N.286.48.B7]